MDNTTNNDHTDTQHIPIEDVDAAAIARGTTRAKVLDALSRGELSPQDIMNVTQQNNDDRQAGYNETQGSGSEQPQTNKTPAQSGYDPAHSGVRHAQNQPGTNPQAPGRETGTSWGEDQQMGKATDTPERKNPAG